MWISKEEYEKLEKIEELESQYECLLSRINEIRHNLGYLIDAHHLKHSDNMMYLNKGDYIGTKKTYSHDNIKIDTDKIKNITLQELAEYVIDNKPIKRTEAVNREYYKDRDEINIEL